MSAEIIINYTNEELDIQIKGESEDKESMLIAGRMVELFSAMQGIAFSDDFSELVGELAESANFIS